MNPNDFYWVYNVKKHLRERKFLAEHKFTDDVICVACGWLEDQKQRISYRQKHWNKCREQVSIDIFSNIVTKKSIKTVLKSDKIWCTSVLVDCVRRRFFLNIITIAPYCC